MSDYRPDLAAEAAGSGRFSRPDMPKAPPWRGAGRGCPTVSGWPGARWRAGRGWSGPRAAGPGSCAAPGGARPLCLLPELEYGGTFRISTKRNLRLVNCVQVAPLETAEALDIYRREREIFSEARAGLCAIGHD